MCFCFGKNALSTIAFPRSVFSCVAANGVVRFSCVALFGLRTFLFPKRRGENKKEREVKGMKEVFLYNEKTNRLHIKGYCQYTKAAINLIQFNREDEALAYDGRAVGMCKICQRKREQR